MGKQTISLTLSQMQAIKHGLRMKVSKRKEFLTGNGYTVSGRAMAEKDQILEEHLIEKFQAYIDNFIAKNNIKLRTK